jgi:hypothetical protein
MDGVLYVVSGQRLYSVSSSWVATDIGGAISGTGVVSMDDNGTQLCVTNGSNGYIYSVSGGFQLITDTDFDAANTVTFFDQRFVFDAAGTNQFFISASLDGTSYDSTQFASQESRPDDVMSVVLNGQILLVFGEKSIEPWQDVGAANFPFERVPGAVIERGLAAAYCTAKEDNAVFFLGDDRVFYRLTGLNPVRVSTHALEQEWQTYTTISNAFAFAHTWNGHKFVYVCFPSENTTFAYDVSTGLWHERVSWDLNGNSYGRWRGNCYAKAYGKEIIGDAFTGGIGYLSGTTYTEFSCTIQGLADAPAIHGDRRRIHHSKFELDVQTGVGITSGQGSDPQIMLDWSNDGGRTYVDRQLWKSMGGKGEYTKRLKWSRLGSARDRRYRLTISDPVPRVIIAAHAEVSAQ